MFSSQSSMTPNTLSPSLSSCTSTCGRVITGRRGCATSYANASVTKPSSLKRVERREIRSLWLFMHCLRCPYYQKSARRISPKLGLPMMLVEEHPSKPFTNGGQLSQEGPKFGYHVNQPKTWLLAKDEHLEKAQALFHSCGINVTTEGGPQLGAPIGTQSFSSEFIQEQVSQWVAEVKTLSSVAKTQPQAAYAAYTHGLAGKWTNLSRACEISSEQFSDFEEVIRLDFILAISGHAVSDIERILLALPARMGGLCLPNPASDADVSYRWSRNATRALVDRMLRRIKNPMAVMEVQRDAFLGQPEVQGSQAG